jgi:predicted metal-binding membrane protein
MSEAPAFEDLLKRNRMITLAGLAALSALAWLYIVTGAAA